MKEGWETKTLGDLFDITSSKRVFESDWKTEGVPFYRAREIVKLAKHGFVENELFISEEMFDRYSAKYGIPAEGDIMVTGVGTLGICYVVNKNDRFYFKDGNIIWLKKKTEANSRFVEYAFQSDYLRSQIDDSVGATVGTYTIIKAKSTRIPIPPLPEQQRIVGILDEAFDGIATAKANAEKNLHNARALFESHLQAVFTQRGEGWVEKRLSEVSKVFGRGKSKHRPRNEPKLFGGKYPFIQTGDVRNANHLITDYSQTYSELGLAQSKLWPAGTLCITIAANIAETGILDFDACFPDSVIGVVVNEKITSNTFLEYLLQSFKAELQSQGKGSAQDNINMGTFENQLFPFPALDSQRKVVATLDSLSFETQRLESIYRQKLAALDELKKSLLHRAFNGEL
jgi:type I restriction enzyme S subunit